MGEDADWVEGDVAPDFDPGLAAQSGADRRAQAGGNQRLGKSHDAVGAGAVRFAETEPVVLFVSDDAGRLNLAGRVDNAADDALGADRLPDAPAGIDGLEAVVLPGTFELVEVPPGQPVLGCHHCSVRPQQRHNGVQGGRHRVRLDREDDVVLRPGIAAVGDQCGVGDAFYAVLDELEAVSLHRRQVRAARDQRHVRAGQRELRPHVATDGARAEDGDPHRVQTSAA